MACIVSLCGAGCPACPSVEVAPEGVTIGETGNLVKLTPEQWNLLVEKVKSGELQAIAEETEIAEECGCSLDL